MTQNEDYEDLFDDEDDQFDEEEGTFEDYDFDYDDSPYRVLISKVERHSETEITVNITVTKRLQAEMFLELGLIGSYVVHSDIAEFKIIGSEVELSNDKAIKGYEMYNNTDSPEDLPLEQERLYYVGYWIYKISDYLIDSRFTEVIE